MTQPRTQFAAPQRLIHWLMAVCIIGILFVGVGMVSSIKPKYLLLLSFHKTLGIAILTLALIRLVMRLTYGAPELPANLPLPLKLAAESSQYVLYLLMLGMPVLGWAMLSASSHPVVLFEGFHLPPIAPVNAQLYTLLRSAHHYLGLAFFALVLAHIGALLFHKLIRNDGIFETMAPSLSKRPTQ